ncbi:hypothetical protein [Wolbachia endosymbiont (group B) of Xanthorhoe designata]|uniref:hypothetical protein n=1 Tax=Wolbachia endosymbiont (group B) of Xanthorhoe designata TaxID=3066184 RepID=UPI00333E5218
MLSQEPEKSVIPIPQQPPVDDPVEETETPQPGNVMVNGADQQANQTEESLPPYPETTSPLNSINQNQPCEQTIENTLLDSLPSYPSTSSPLNSLDQTFPSLPIFVKLRVALDQFKQQQHNGIDSHKADDVCSVTSTDVSITTSVSCSNHASMTDSYTSWSTNWDDSTIQSLAYQHESSVTSITEDVESGPEAIPYKVNDNRNPYSSMQSPVSSSFDNRSNSLPEQKSF